MKGVVAPKGVRILIRGETGTGRELIAEAIHTLSLRKDMPFIKVNCAALTRELLTFQLFGHLKGSFTGATENSPGLIEAADRGTLFLDEIGDLSCNAQATLLRFLQEGEVMPIGSTRTVKADVRVVSATNRDLRTAIKRGRFRNDLYQRPNFFQGKRSGSRQERGYLHRFSGRR